MSDAQQAPATSPANPWMIALTVLWAGLLALALLLLILGGNADAQGFDSPTGPPADVLAGIYFACGGVAGATALVVLGVQLGVGALRWHLDPASRPVPTPAATVRPARQDF